MCTNAVELDERDMCTNALLIKMIVIERIIMKDLLYRKPVAIKVKLKA